MRRGWTMVALASLLAGCASGADPLIAEGASFDDFTGAIQGVVTDDAVIPLADVAVSTDGGAFTTTDASGEFRLSFVAPGPVTLTFGKEGYANATRSLSVESGAVATLSIILNPLGADVPFHTTQQDAGRMMCAADTRPRPFALNICGALALFVPQTGDDSLGLFTLTGNSSRLAELVFETQWSTNQATGRGLEAFWEAYQKITDPTTFPEGAPKRFAQYGGVSPLRASANVTVIQTIIHAQPAPLYCHVGAPCMVMARTFPRATTLGPTAPADAAFYVDQTFTHYVTEFYRVGSQSGFTALADA